MEHCLKSLELGLPQRAGALSMFPLMGADLGPVAHQTLARAMADGSIEVEEISPEGRVPELLIKNHGAVTVLLLDGDTVAGAKQNRTLNSALLVPGKAQVRVAVSCVEQGRWRSVSRRFRHDRGHLYAEARATLMHDVSESVVRGDGHRSDQARLWRRIRFKLRRHRVRTSSSDMQELYRSRNAELQRGLELLRWRSGQRGALFMSGEDFIGLDLFAHALTFRDVFEQVVRSYLLDALSPQVEVAGPNVALARAVLSELSVCRVVEGAAQGGGRELRLQGATLVGCALLDADVVAHLSAFPRPGACRESDLESPEMIA